MRLLAHRFWASPPTSRSRALPTSPAAPDECGGRLTIAGLATGSYGVLTSHSSSANYTNEIYNDIQCPTGCSTTTAVESGTPVPVVLGATTSGINFAVAAGGTITGTVTNESTGTPIQSVTVVAVVVVGNSVFVKSSSTNASGNYSITGLPPGSYGLYNEQHEFHQRDLRQHGVPGLRVQFDDGRQHRHAGAGDGTRHGVRPEFRAAAACGHRGDHQGNGDRCGLGPPESRASRWRSGR